MIALHREHTFLRSVRSGILLARNIRYEEDLVDNSSIPAREAGAASAVARHFGKKESPRRYPKISQETLAEMIGTTRSRVSFFMNRFRELGFLDYGGSGAASS